MPILETGALPWSDKDRPKYPPTPHQFYPWSTMVDSYNLPLDSAPMVPILSYCPELQLSDIILAHTYQTIRGGHSDVCMVNVKCGDSIIVAALKVPRPYGITQEAFRKSLNREVACWNLFHHENIAPLMGICPQWYGSRLAMISPWYKNGTAGDYLAQKPDIDPILILKGTASAIAYMHDNGVIHGDIKATNIMVDDFGQARLIDFGLAHMDGRLDLDPPEGLFSIRWCAPELLTDGVSTRASDVYAFASTAFELLSGRVPYDTMNERVVVGALTKGILPWDVSEDLPRLRRHHGAHESKEFLALLKLCWGEAAGRPSMADVRLRLVEIFA